MSLRILISSMNDGSKLYCKAVSAAGAQPDSVYCPPAESVNDYDALILTGGGDALPELFGEEDYGVSYDFDPPRDAAEMALIAAFRDAGKPILGICRGAQMLNIALGGTILQDLPDEVRPKHRIPDGTVYHATKATADSYIGGLYGTDFRVNSIHHQALSRLGEGVVPCQWSEEQIVEAYYVENEPIWGVQWHPERMCDPKYRPDDVVDGTPLFSWWIRKVKEDQENR